MDAVVAAVASMEGVLALYIQLVPYQKSRKIILCSTLERVRFSMLTERYIVYPFYC